MSLETGDLVVGLSGKVALTQEGSVLLPRLTPSLKTRLSLAPPALIQQSLRRKARTPVDTTSGGANSSSS